MTKLDQKDVYGYLMYLYWKEAELREMRRTQFGCAVLPKEIEKLERECQELRKIVEQITKKQLLEELRKNRRTLKSMIKRHQKEWVPPAKAEEFQKITAETYGIVVREGQCIIRELQKRSAPSDKRHIDAWERMKEKAAIELGIASAATEAKQKHSRKL